MPFEGSIYCSKHIVDLLRHQIGFQNPLSNFRIAMRQVVAANAIPDYDIRLIEDAPAPPPAEGEERKVGRRPAKARVIVTRRAPALTEADEEPAEA